MKKNLILVALAFFASASSFAGAYVECKGKRLTLTSHYSIDREDRRKGVFDVVITLDGEALPTFKRTDITILESDKLIRDHTNSNVIGTKDDNIFKINLPNTLFGWDSVDDWATKLSVTTSNDFVYENLVCTSELDYELNITF